MRTIIVYTGLVIKNVTFSVEDADLTRARNAASARGTSLNEEFRRWLKSYGEQQDRAGRLSRLFADLSYCRPGRKFSRDEMNER